MQAWVCDDPIGVQALQWKQMETPEPAAGEVRIAIHAASLNFPDLLIVQNKYQVKPPLPFVPGAEFSGRIEAVGEGVTHLHVGDPVAAIGATGGFATHACVKATSVIPLPSHIALEDAAAFAFTYGTSHHALMDRGALQPGETVLVLGAAGGVGTSAIQIAKAAGARVIAAASSDEKCQLCTEIGADATINYSTTDLREAIKTLTDGKGPDVVYDPVGGDFATAAFRSIAWRGRYLVIGFTAGSIPAVPWNLPLLKGASVVGVFWGEFVRREPRASAAAMAQLADWYAQGKIKPVIDTRLPMSELHAAYERMGTRQVRGKVLLINP
ncbi:MAG: NADPH:quinone oxidoreductase family protein [Aquincola sp.]|uniref:NADPH:quinone oxidoreductase family protein n=1 Tax=uncultured Aquincola sp. TaxID=886556 RepID=UPI0032B2AED2|nr:NADPH:quinone oxidoreductase family protein [Aquincola sp.]